jgi:hypothetical protein
MKSKIALVVLLAAGFMASFAVTASAKGPKNQTTNTTTTQQNKPKACRPVVSLILNGKFKAVNTEQSGPAFDMTVTATNAIAKPYKKLGTATVLVASTTKIKLNGKPVALDKLQAGDKLTVQARVCKSSIPTGAPTAKRVTAKRPKTTS